MRRNFALAARAQSGPSLQCGATLGARGVCGGEGRKWGMAMPRASPDRWSLGMPRAKVCQRVTCFNAQRPAHA
jgi:hypothetical protein